MNIHNSVGRGWVLVTGAASGIGRSVARAVAAQGGRVVAADVDAAGLSTLRSEGQAHGWSLVSEVLDVSEPEAVQRALTSVTGDGRLLAGLVHCAGITSKGKLLDMTMSNYHRIVETNLTGSFVCMTETARALVDQGNGGTIVVITSINAQRPLLNQAAYSACKAAIEVLVSMLALELAPHSIRVNAVAPGAVDTAMNPKSAADPAVIARIPLGSIGAPEEVAGPALFLMSEQASYITGASLVVDGGLVHVRP